MEYAQGGDLFNVSFLLLPKLPCPAPTYPVLMNRWLRNNNSRHSCMLPFLTASDSV